MQIDGIPDYVTPARAQFRFMVRTNLLEKSTKSPFIWGHELGVQTVVKKVTTLTHKVISTPIV